MPRFQFHLVIGPNQVEVKNLKFRTPEERRRHVFSFIFFFVFVILLCLISLWTWTWSHRKLKMTRLIVS